MNRDMQIAEAVRDAVCNSISAFLPENKQRVVDNFGREVNLAAIITASAPNNPEAEPLTEEEIEVLWYKHPSSLPFARAIERRIQARNKSEGRIK